MQPATHDQRLRLPGLLEYRASASRRRAEAFCDAPEYVLGQPVCPLTPATFSKLLAMASPFVSGGVPSGEDVAVYLWLHSPEYSHCGVVGWQARKRHALRSFSRELHQPWRRWVGLKPSRERIGAVIAIATAEIRRLVDEAFADAPCPAGEPGTPLATMEGQLIHEFARAYGWKPEETRRMSLRQLFQLHRCIRASRGEDVKDVGECAIIAEHLRCRNEELAPERARLAAMETASPSGRN